MAYRKLEDESDRRVDTLAVCVDVELKDDVTECAWQRRITRSEWIREAMETKVKKEKELSE